jgi:hypothetical protein
MQETTVENVHTPHVIHELVVHLLITEERHSNEHQLAVAGARCVAVEFVCTVLRFSLLLWSLALFALVSGALLFLFPSCCCCRRRDA